MLPSSSLSLLLSLDFDSLLKEEVFKKLEDEFRINFSNKDSLASIDATIKYVASHPKAR